MYPMSNFEAFTVLSHPLHKSFSTHNSYDWIAASLNFLQYCFSSFFSFAMFYTDKRVEYLLLFVESYSISYRYLHVSSSADTYA